MNRIELVLVLLFTFFVIVVWITSDVILAKPNTPDDPKLQAMLEPLTPTFDKQTIDLVNSTKPEIPTTQKNPSPTNQPIQPTIPLQTPTPSPKASNSPTFNRLIQTSPQPSSSSSASLIFGNNTNTANTSEGVPTQ